LNKIDLLHDKGKINDFMYGILSRSKGAMDLVLWDESVRDALEATEAGVNNERDYQVFHYIDVFVEDLSEEIFGVRLSEKEEAGLKIYMFELREEIDYANLVSFWVAIVKWLSTRNIREAYPNKGDNGSRYMKKQQTHIWAKLANEINKMITKGIEEKKALNQAAGVLHPRERLDFVAWYRFKFGKLTKLYNVNNIIQNLGEGTMKIKPNKTGKFAGIHEEQGRYYLPEFNMPPFMAVDEEVKEEPEAKLERETNFQEARSKLVSRTFAIDKLLERYYEIIGKEGLGEIEDALNALRKKIRSLKCANTILDTVIKTANIVKKRGFNAGAVGLESLAYDFVGQKNPIIKKAFDAGQIAPILAELQSISNQLKRRDIVRELAKMDFKLHDMNAAALFPELGDAQAKLIEATTYASNKLEDVIPKLRSVSEGGASVPGTEEAPAPSPTEGPEPPSLTAPKTKAPSLKQPPAPTPASPPTPTPPAPTPPPTPTPAPAGISDFEKAI
jgi:hypothetical protein